MTKRPLRVLSIFGTRPEAVKMAPVIRRLAITPDIASVVCITAQHRQMLDQVLDLFEIKPDYDLDIMKSDQSLSELTAALFSGLDPVLQAVQPDWVLIQGDTTTAAAAALIAYYHGVRLGHVEAGLRTGDKWQPFPEEINRCVAGVIADLHFAPTTQARDNLLHEGTPPDRILVTGNPVIDALQDIIARPYEVESGPLAGIPWDRRVILVTAHRRENFGQPLENIFSALLRIAKSYSERVHLVYPVHLNPKVYDPAQGMLGGVSNITLLEPLGYLHMVHLMNRAYLVLTDSGGIQEEAPAVGTPVLVLRRVTERREAIEAGTALLVGTDPERIVAETSRLLDDSGLHAEMARAVNPFGDGQASGRIVEGLINFSQGTSAP